MSQNKRTLQYGREVRRVPALLWVGGCSTAIGIVMAVIAVRFSFTLPPVPQWVGIVGWISSLGCLPVFTVGLILLVFGVSRRKAVVNDLAYGPARGMQRSAVVWIVGLTIILVLICVFLPKLFAK